MTGLAGFGALVRLALRRDRIILPIWVVLLSALPTSAVSAYEQLYPTAADRATLNAGTASNPSVAVIYGPAYDLLTPGGFTAWRYGSFLALFVGLMAVFTVTRHTRAEEETGRLELLGSAVVGRYAALTAAVVVAAGASLLIGLATSLGLVGAGLPAAGSFVLGFGIAGTGLAFTAVAAVAAQLTEFARSANGFATGALGVAFLLRAIGDSTPSVRWVSWLSPLAWPQLAKPFVDNRWWVVPMATAVAIAVAAFAYRLVPKRDLGAGLFASRLGPAAAAGSLASPLGLAWRLQRGPLIGWTVALAVFGAVFGSIADGITGLIGNSEQVREIFAKIGGAQGLVDAYLAAIAGVFGMVVAVFAVQAALRARGEEVAGRVEPVLATGVSRIGWLTSHSVFTLLGPVVLLAVSGAAAGIAHGLRAGDLATQVGHAVSGSMAQLPAVWVVAAVATLVFGLAPKVAVPVSWTVVGVALVLALFGPVVGLAQVVLDLSPFTHVPKLPGAEFSWTPTVWLSGVAVLGICTGMAAFRRRDVG